MHSSEGNASNANVGYMPGIRGKKREREEKRGLRKETVEARALFYDSSAAVSKVARRNKTDFHDGIMPGRNMCIGSLRAR